jgi:hypothetical protein
MSAISSSVMSRAVHENVAYETLAEWLRDSGAFDLTGETAVEFDSDDSAVMLSIPEVAGPDSEVIISMEAGEMTVELIWGEKRAATLIDADSVAASHFYVPRSKTVYIDLDSEPTVARVVGAIESLIENA